MGWGGWDFGGGVRHSCLGVSELDFVKESFYCSEADEL